MKNYEELWEIMKNYEKRKNKMLHETQKVMKNYDKLWTIIESCEKLWKNCEKIVKNCSVE